MYEVVYHFWEVFNSERVRQHYVMPKRYPSKEKAVQISRIYRMSRTFNYKFGDRISVRKARV